MGFIYHIGKYFLMLKKTLAKPESTKIYFNQIIKELDKLGLSSVGIVVIISFFIGAVITIQTGYNISTPFIPRYIIGMITRDSIILEFSSTIVSLILAGKVGSNIASELGSMRVSEQIDALEIMGINSASFLILPKIIASLLINPCLVIISMTIGIAGGWIGGTILTHVISVTDYVHGLQYYFQPYYITYTLIKTEVFAFIITTVSSYWGYYTVGGALEVGKASTKAVVYSTVLILLFNLLLTQLLLS
ncbi:MAG: ABC transporter permease [Bacteroidia bacterium]|nr:ABC transporter permease [Bacteroidia bacterium]